MDNILIAHEIFDSLLKKRDRKKSFDALKINMSKGYDKVDQNFLKAIFYPMRFSPKWVNWIMECVAIVSYTLVINGSTSKSFIPSRGLR